MANGGLQIKKYSLWSLLEPILKLFLSQRSYEDICWFDNTWIQL